MKGLLASFKQCLVMGIKIDVEFIAIAKLYIPNGYGKTHNFTKT